MAKVSDGERKMQHAEYQNRKGAWKQANGRRINLAPEEPPLGEAGMKGKVRNGNLSSKNRKQMDERKSEEGKSTESESKR